VIVHHNQVIASIAQAIVVNQRVAWLSPSATTVLGRLESSRFGLAKQSNRTVRATQNSYKTKNKTAER